MNKPGVLIIESSDWDREQIRTCLRDLPRGVRLLNAADAEAGRARVDLVVVGCSDAVSLETARATLERVRERHAQAQLILCAPRDLPDLDARVLALRARAFVLKPIDESRLGALLDETLAQIERRHQREAYARSARKTARKGQIVGTSAALRSVMTLLERVAKSDSTSVLLMGETGVGKSLFAQSLHELGARAEGPFIEINCATIPHALLESELFGYEPGAFTDARARKMGLVELADGGTLFLDEITEIDLVTQAKLLRVLDTKRFRRLGGAHEIAVEVRVVAATNHALKEEVRAGRFREDLYYRLNVVEIRVPALRERPEDIDAIAAHYLAYFQKKFHKPAMKLSEEAWDLIRAYPWPGNVRELVNVLERAALLCNSDVIAPEHLPIEPARPERGAPRVLDIRERPDGELELKLPPQGVALDALERAVIVEILARTRGNVSRAAEMLGLSRGALRNRLNRYRIDPHAFHRPRVLVER
jgi:DNA-binding NtrC family response regulator